MSNISKSAERRASAKKSSRPEVITDVLGPLTVLAPPIYVDDKDCPVLLATLPNGMAVAIEELVSVVRADNPVSLFGHLKAGDVIVCEGAVRADSCCESANWQQSSGRYYAGGDVYQLVNGKVVDLVEKLMDGE